MSVMVEYFDWTEERIAFLRERVADGVGPSAIAREFQAKTKSRVPTRNAVIGKCNRLGLARYPGEHSRRLQYREDGQRVKLQRKKEKPPAPPKPPKPVTADKLPAVKLGPMKLANGQTCKVVDLNDSMCKYPIGDPMDQDFAFCARGADGAGPYCSDHKRLCYDTPAKRAKQQSNAARARAALNKKLREAAA